MKKLLVILLTMSLIFVVATPINAKDFSNKIIEQVRQSVLQVRGSSGWGAGVVVSKKQMLTAYHVVQNRSGIDEMILIRIYDEKGNEWKAEVIATDKDNDLALLGLLEGEFTCEPVKVVKTYKVGDPIFTIGYPLQGMEDQAKELIPDEDETSNPIARIGFGHISDIRRKLVYIDIGTYSFGSSGGGTFDKRGRLIGINSLIACDGCGKFGVIRPIYATGFNLKMVIPSESKKKLSEVTYIDKWNAIKKYVMYTSGNPAYHYNGRRGAPVWIKRIMLSNGWMTEEEKKANPEKYKFWIDSHLPDKQYLEIHAGPGIGLWICEVRIWNHSGEGYEKMTLNYNIGYEFTSIYNEKKEYQGIKYGGLTLWKIMKIYIVCSENNIILNVHGGSWITNLDVEEEKPNAEKWFDYVWEKFLVPHWNGEM